MAAWRSRKLQLLLFSCWICSDQKQPVKFWPPFTAWIVRSVFSSERLANLFSDWCISAATSLNPDIFLCNEELQVQVWHFKHGSRSTGFYGHKAVSLVEQNKWCSSPELGTDEHISLCLTGADHMPDLATTRRTSWKDKVLKRMIFKHNHLQRLYFSQFQHILELIITNVGYGCHISSPHVFASALQGSVQPVLVAALAGCSPAAVQLLYINCLPSVVQLANFSAWELNNQRHPSHGAMHATPSHCCVIQKHPPRWGRDALGTTQMWMVTFNKNEGQGLAPTAFYVWKMWCRAQSVVKDSAAAVSCLAQHLHKLVYSL